MEEGIFRLFPLPDTLYTKISSAKMRSQFIFSLSICVLCPFLLIDARIFSLEMHHRFSDPMKEWSRRSRTNSQVHNWPEKGSIEYYALLASHDHTLHRRTLSTLDGGGTLTFSDGNATFRISSLGFLHYTTVMLGTPGMKFLVALDTGSDLFWVPCHCVKCASTNDSPYTYDFGLSIYDQERSSTSKNVTCNNDLCTYRDSCNDASNHCPYYVSYVSSETSTSGILLEDVLHLRSLDNDQEFIQAYVTFGCGQVQTGSFIDIAAPNGLFGLGFEKVSVPSVLFREGYAANSFSMCFGQDGKGRINFGDKGSLDQEETPFNMNSLHPTYNVNVNQVRVGTTVLDLKFTAVFDTGTSFTYLVDPSYTMLSDSFHLHVRDKRRPPDPRMPFEYCYIMSSNTSTSLIPGMSLTLDGGGQMVVYDPIIVISNPHEFVYCLAVVKSQELNIIGQNFMTGYRIVFDREKLVLGWKKFDCYGIDDDSKALGPKPVNYASMPPLPDNYTQSNELNRNIAPKLFASSLYIHSILDLIHSLLISLVLVFQWL